MNTEDKIKFWKEKAKECIKIAENQFRDKNYLWCLFFCHLSLEKALKAKVIKNTKKESPYTHSLIILAKLSAIQLEEDNLVDLETITDFNIETRYDDYRESLKKKANKSYTEKYLKITKKYLKWFLNQN